MQQQDSRSIARSVPVAFAVQLESITKTFPGVVANQDVSLDVSAATFHAVIGENGAGKSTLLNILYGRYRPDSGRILVAGEDVTGALRSPADAIRRGLGLVSQHYALIPALTVLENIILGAEPAGFGGSIDRRSARERIQQIVADLQLDPLDLAARADRVSIAAGQKIEIVKALYRGARILLLDEPTATLAPQEADRLFALLQALLTRGATIVFVTHKLREVLAYSQNVTVLRAGRNAGDFVTADTSAEELLSCMIGPRAEAARLASDPSSPAAAGTSCDAEPPAAIVQDAPSPAAAAPTTGQRAEATAGAVQDAVTPPATAGEHAGGVETGVQIAPSAPPPAAGTSGQHAEAAAGATQDEAIASNRIPVLKISGLTVKGRLGSVAVREVSLEVAPGEILGVAGVDGSGQRELSEAIVGLRAPYAGTMEILAPGRGDFAVLNRLSVRQRQQTGIGYIPEDRHRTALALDFNIAENYLLGHEDSSGWGGGPILNKARMQERANTMIREYDVRMGSRDARAPARALSGGNQQKVVIARALDGQPRLLVACQPTRGLDVEAARFVYRALRHAKAQGLAILLFSLDLDEILELSDRIAVMFNAEIAGVTPRDEATPERIGALMTGAGLPAAPRQTVLP